MSLETTISMIFRSGSTPREVARRCRKLRDKVLIESSDDDGIKML
jgi:hypothetical protein